MKVSGLKVMRSNAGYYIGRSMNDVEFGDMPYDRKSMYFKSYQQACDALLTLFN